MSCNPDFSPVYLNASPAGGEESGKYGFDLLKYTLESVRNDTTTSRDMQQKIIQAFATVFASILLGGLVYASQTTIQKNGLVIVLLFNLAAPTFAGIASVIFTGELIRQGRAATLNRGLETWARKQPSMHLYGTNESIPSLFIETYYGARVQTHGITRGYGVALYYCAILLLFGGAIAVSSSLGILFSSLDTNGPGFVTFSSIISGAFLIAWITLTLLQARVVTALADETPDFPTAMGFSTPLSSVLQSGAGVTARHAGPEAGGGGAAVGPSGPLGPA